MNEQVRRNMARSYDRTNNLEPMISNTTEVSDESDDMFDLAVLQNTAINMS